MSPLARSLGLLLVCVATLVALGYSGITLLYAGRNHYQLAQMANLAEATVLNGAVPCMVGVLFGLVGSRARSRPAAYGALVLMTLLMTPVFSEVVAGAMGTMRLGDVAVLVVSATVRLVAIAAPEAGWVQDGAYLAPVESSRWVLAAGWLGVLGFALWVQRRRERWAGIVIAVGIIIGAAFVAFTWLDSIPRHDRLPTSASTGLSTLMSQQPPRPVDELPDSARALSYGLDFAIGRRLEADALVEVSGIPSGVQRVPFTLFRGYRMKRVSDGSGKSLEFTQDGDRVEVSRSPDDRYEFEYVGSGWGFYSNRQGVFLPASFPYYPWLGEHEYWTQNAEALPRSVDATAAFSVAVDSLLPVYSNLGWLSAERTLATAHGLTMMAGDISVEQQGSWTFAGPRSARVDVTPARASTRTEELISLLGIEVHEAPERRTFFFASTMSAGGWYLEYPVLVGDQVIWAAESASADRIAVQAALADLPPESRSNALYECLRGYLADPATFLAMYEQRPQPIDVGRGMVLEPPDREVIAFGFAQAVRAKGQRPVVKATYNYLKVLPAGTTPAEFLSIL